MPVYVREGAVIPAVELEQYVGERNEKGMVNPCLPAYKNNKMSMLLNKMFKKDGIFGIVMIYYTYKTD